MHRLSHAHRHPLHDQAATRAIEQAAAAALPPQALMQRAGLAVARLALALAPHARRIWIACGPGNNGGDGLEAAMQLQRRGAYPIVTWLGDEARAPADARAALARAREAGVAFADEPPSGLGPQDLCIDALLGLGGARPPEGRMASWIAAMNLCPAPTLAVDLPSGLAADTGNYAADRTPGHVEKTADQVRAQHTLSLLTLKPGLFTAHGRDACGTLWFDDLGVAAHAPPSAWLAGAPLPCARPHASHKGSFGDVAVIGGEGLAARGLGMSGAALLAASAALHGGAGRVLVSLLDGGAMALDCAQPELMLRRFEALDLSRLTVACGCGGGEAVRAVLPAVLSRSPRLVLDADALNAIAADPQLQTLLDRRAARGLASVLTPHPLEAARLLGCSAAEVQADRLAAARRLAQRHGCVVVLKGSGTVIAAPDEPPVINPSGNARLATAGTGDVLAGLIGARLASGLPTLAAACEAVYQHGAAADAWPIDRALTAGALARRLRA
ncbi:NAD(P)H-hydrate dehydratase [Ramlibacter sp. 2FC]|uniref:NAD(P)H-hydrate dehydratase n=1 Tax=Ramlibacter sp. 2FC TaxID=2502188 RepID=UPI0010F4C98D|nr:NAD(P)H-hydrate dehydratase [Ramlibacter sp. 2FC]